MPETVGLKPDPQRSQTESLTTSGFYALEFYNSRRNPSATR